MRSESTATRWLRILMGVLVLWDLGLGIWAVLFTGHFEELIRFDSRPEPLFVRGVGLYWLFAAYMQWLGFRDPIRFVTAVQLTIVFRLSAAVIDTAEAVFLLPRPLYFFHYLLLFFVAMNCLIAFATARLLREVGLPWIEAT